MDVAFRRLCDQLYLKAETQQVDRILEAFSQRFWACNPNSIYGSADTVHGMVFSLLLLNTDLHVAEITDRMTRGQFIRNTMAAIGEQHGIEVLGSNPTSDDSTSTFSDPNMSDTGLAKRQAGVPSVGSLSSVGNEQSVYSSAHTSSPNVGQGATSRKPSGAVLPMPSPQTRARSVTNGSIDSGRTPFQSKAWAVEMESLLKVSHMFAVMLLPFSEHSHPLRRTSMLQSGQTRSACRL